MLTLQSQLTQINSFQDKLTNFIGAYERNCLQQIDLPAPPPPQLKQSPTNQDQINNPINLSRVFQEIKLRDELLNSRTSKIEVELNVQSQIYHLQLSKQSAYRLSNFNSFNNQAPQEDPQPFELLDLLTKIQQKVGKQLSNRGVQNIIGQIHNHLIHLTLQAQPQHPRQTQSHTEKENLEQSTLADSTLSQLNHSQHHCQPSSAHNNAHKYENNLNSQPFHKTKHRKDTYQSNMKGHKQTLKVQSNKENSFIWKSSAKQLKQLKIVRKNKNSSNSLMMLFSDFKSVDNFCITNKLYGKERDKILKAVHTDKTVVHLQ